MARQRYTRPGRPRKYERSVYKLITFDGRELDFCDDHRGKLSRGEWFTVAQHNPTLENIATLKVELANKTRYAQELEDQISAFKEKNADIETAANELRDRQWRRNGVVKTAGMIILDGMAKFDWNEITREYAFKNSAAAKTWMIPKINEINKFMEDNLPLWDKIKKDFIKLRVDAHVADYNTPEKQHFYHFVVLTPEEREDTLLKIQAMNAERLAEANKPELIPEAKPTVKAVSEADIEKEKMIFKYEHWDEIATPEEKITWWEKYRDTLVGWHAYNYNCEGLCSCNFLSDVKLFSLCSGKAEDELISLFKVQAKAEFKRFSNEKILARVAEIGYEQHLEERRKSHDEDLCYGWTKVNFGSEFPVKLIDGKLKYIDPEKK